MVEPYQEGLFEDNPFASKCPVEGKLVAVLRGRLEKRGLELMTPISRALWRGEIHELIVTGEKEVRPGRRVDKIAYLGFFEVVSGGVVVWGDEVHIGERWVGRVAGFDGTHQPNHINIVLQGNQCLTGVELGLELGGRVVFRAPGN